MSFYIASEKTIYTDETFPHSLEKSKIWQDRNQRHLQIKSLDDFARALNLVFISEIEPNVYVWNDEIVMIPHKGAFVTESNLVAYATSRLKQPLHVPAYLTGLLKVRFLLQEGQKQDQSLKDYLETKSTN